MPDIDTIIAKWKASFAVRARYEGQEPREDELIIAEVERLRGDIDRFNSPPNPSEHRMTEGELGEFQSAMADMLDCESADVWAIRALAEAWMLGREYGRQLEPHPTEPGKVRRKGGE